MKKAAISLIFVVLAGLGTSCQKEPEVQQPVVARVGTSTLTAQDIITDLYNSWGDEVLREQVTEYINRWINSEVLYQAAIQSGLDKDPRVVRIMDNTRREYLADLYFQRRMKDTVDLPDEEITRYYEKNRETFKREEMERHIYHILVDTPEKAKELRRQLRGGADFAETARHHSLGPAAERGGDLGYVTRADLTPEIAKIAFKYKKGYIPPYFQTEYGYHIIKIIDVQRKGTYRSLEEVREDIRLRLRAQWLKRRYTRLVEDSKKQAEIKVDVKILDAMLSDSSFVRPSKHTDLSEPKNTVVDGD